MSITRPSGAITGVTATLTNLLPYVGDLLTMPDLGVYLGEGLPPVPDKLAAKIRRGEFIEMGELLPEFWLPMKGEEESSKETKGRKS